ncbi:MAG: type II secretion system protein, partial [Eubacterium sp.]|nr:type II secretion system protein [Eubacterium sp.]
MKKNNKGFTLVELIVVLVILAILAAVLVPALLGYIDKAKKKKDMNA